MLTATLIVSAGARAVTVPGCEPPGPGGDWPIYGNTIDNHRNQTAEQSIGVSNVGELELAWQVPMEDLSTIHSTPTVADGCVFVGTNSARVLAINIRTGKVVWDTFIGGAGQGNYFVGAGIIGAPAIANGLVYVAVTAASDSRVVALDQVTGQIVWTSIIDSDSGGGVDASPVPFNGMILQGYQGDESSNHSNPGWVILDGSRAGGGAILVKTHTIPPTDFAAGDRGGSVVGTPALDLARKLAFIGTGNPASERQNPRTNSLLKVDLDPTHATFGQVLDQVRGTSDSYPFPGDTESPVCNTNLQWPIGRYSCFEFDYNFLASPNLWADGKGRVLMGELQKSGVYLAVDTADMKPVWRATLALPCFACNLSSSAVDDDAVYVATTGGNLYALNRDTGLPKWAVPLTGVFHYNGVSVANGVVYNVNDLGLLEAFDAATGRPLLVHPFALDNRMFNQDLGNSSGLSIARNTVFVTSAPQGGGSTLFAFRLPGS
jgi:outer membrane protein assembly factor BamB